MLGALISTLISPYGMFAVASGLLLFFLLPAVPRALGIFRAFANLHLWLGARMLKRATVVVAEQGDLLLKRMRPNDVGTEEVEFQDTTKEFEDPHQAKSSWMGIPFAFADEVHGVMFSLRDGAIGRRKKRAEEKDEMVIRATESESQMYEIMAWVRGVLEFPEGRHELVNLNHIRQLMTGSERAEHPQRVKTYYQNSREPYKDGRSTAEYIMLIVALLAPFGMMFLIWQQMSGQGNVGGSTIVGTLLLAVPSLGELRDRIQAVDWSAVRAAIIHAVKVAVVVLPLPLTFLGIGYFVNPTFSMILLLIFAAGFLLIPLLVELLKVSDGITGTLSKTLLKMGLLAYSKPVFEETQRGYRIREFDQLDDVDESNIVWHTLLGRQFGFTFTPDRDMWGTELADTQRLRNERLFATESAAKRTDEIRYTDGGDEVQNVSAATTNLPSGYAIVPEKQRAVYGSMVPAKLRDGCYYLLTGVALQRFANVATGEKTMKRLEKSKEEFGEEGDQSRGLVWAIAVLGILSLLAGIVVFFFLIGV